MQKRSDWKIFLYFMSYLKPVWDKALLLALMLIILTLVDINTIILPLLIRKFIDQVLGQQDWEMFRILVIVIITQIVLFLSFYFLSEILKYAISIRLGINLAMNVFTHTLRLPLRFFQKRPIGEHMYRVGSVFDPGFANIAVAGLLFELTGTAKADQQPMFGKDVDGVLGMMTQSLDLLIRVIFRLIFILFTITFGFSREIGIALFIFCIPYAWGIHKFYNIQRRIDFKFRARSQNFLAGLQEWFAGVKTIRAFAKGKYAVHKNIALYIKMLRVEFQNFFTKLATDNFIFIFRYTFIVCALCYGAIKQAQTAGALFALYLLLDQFLSPINLLLRVVEGIRLQLVPARRLMDTLDEENTIVEKQDAVTISSFNGPFVLNHISFRYTADKEILSDISLRIDPGKKIGIVGPSGSGKTSLINLLMRFYDPDSGEVLTGDINLRDIRLHPYYENIGIILQEDFLFDGTVYENIRYGKPDATEQNIFDAAKKALIHDDILNLPSGYDTPLGESTKISGGQRQRIAIARALVREPNILILDEATNSLDAPTAGGILTRLMSPDNPLTVIMITHRLHSVCNCDDIILLENGKIREHGTFEQLIRQNGIFAGLYRKQMNIQSE